MARFQSSTRDAEKQVQEHLVEGRYTCPFCRQTATPKKIYGTQSEGGSADYKIFSTAVVICAACGEESIWVQKWEWVQSGPGSVAATVYWHKLLHPAGRAPKRFQHTPKEHLKAYEAACRILETSPEASACMSRRCLQQVLAEHGYKGHDLAKQVDAVLAETDPKKVLPGDVHDCVDVIRNFGNFGAHPINDKTALQIIEVEPREAEWCIEICERLFEHYYERPKQFAERLKAANIKLKSAGKPEAKG